MNRPAVIYGHPASLHTPQNVERLESQTGRKAVIVGHSIKCVPFDDYELVMRHDSLEFGAFPSEAA